MWAGNWKAVRQKLKPAARTGLFKTELYDLAADPTESRDVAGDHPDVLKRLETILAEQHVPAKDFAIPVLDRAAP